MVLGDENDHSPEDISCPQQVFDIDFHPSTNNVVLGMVDGVVEVYQYSEQKSTKVLHLKHHTDACRSVLFSLDGKALYTASSDCSIRAVDTQGGINWAQLNAHSSPVNCLQSISTDIIASGDDEGCVKIWDTRQHRCVSEWKYHKDFISDMTCNNEMDHLLCTSGDGRLSVYDLRKSILVGQSDELDDELLSISVIKNGKKVVCGSQDGVLVIFSWGTWGDMSDRFPGHPDSVDAIVKVDEDTVCTGSCDGIIRVVQIHPNKLLGLVGDHEDFPVEVMKLSHDKRLIGSISHTNKVHFWDVGYLYDDDDEDDEDVEEKTCDTTDNVDGMSDICSDDDSDSSANDGAGGRRAMPTANEAFFSDL